MFGSADGSAQANISGSQIESLEVPLPPLAEQKAIAAVLGALDDKIELNRRMNATLEAMARVLFQSWFVDFDPVRRNMDAESFTWRRGSRGESQRKSQKSNSPLRASAPPSDPSAALFPDSFQDSELGPIPKGGKVCPLSETIELLSGGHANLKIIGVADVEPAVRILQEVNPKHRWRNWLPMHDVLRNSNREYGSRKASDFRGLQIS